MLSWEFSEILKNYFFTKHLLTTACGHFHSLNKLTVFFAFQWTSRNQAFYICKHVLLWLSSVMNIMSFAFGKLYEIKRPIEAAVRRCSSKKVFLKISQISQVFSREICEMFTFLQNNSGGCFLTQLLLHRKTDFCDIPRGIRLINNWQSFIYTCWISVFCAVIFYLKGHRSGHQRCFISIKKAFRNIHRKAPVFLIKGTPNY